MKIPTDPVIMLSFINTQLRDNYNSFDDLCKAYNVDKHEIADKLALIGYEYNSNNNQFV